jgi:hypothetical protein
MEWRITIRLYTLNPVGVDVPDISAHILVAYRLEQVDILFYLLGMFISLAGKDSLSCPMVLYN